MPELWLRLRGTDALTKGWPPSLSSIFVARGWKRDFCTDSYSTDTHIHMWQKLF